jgi:hypothetical protein
MIVWVYDDTNLNRQWDGGEIIYSQPPAYGGLFYWDNPVKIDLAIMHTAEIGGTGNFFFSVQSALAAASPGDTVLVAPGIYYEAVDINEPVNIASTDGPSTTIIDGTGAGLTSAGLVKITAAGDVTFSGFTVQRAPADTGGVTFGILLQSSVSGVTYTISNNNIYGTNNPDDGQDYGFYSQSDSANVVFTHNMITQTGANNIVFELHTGATEISHNILDAGVYGSDAIFFMTYDGFDVTTLQNVSYNTFNMSTGGPFDYSHRASAISFNTPCAAWGLADAKFTNVVIQGNTINNLTSYRRGIGFWNGGGSGGGIISPVVEENTITGVAGSTASYGIDFLVTGSAPAATDATVVNNVISNTAYGIYLRNASCAPGALINYNNIAGNTVGLDNTAGPSVDAQYNWWGKATGPYNPTSNPSGKGDPVTDNVDYTPYLPSPLYQVTFSQTGVGSDFTGTVVTVDGTNYNVSGLPVSFVWNPNSVHNFTFASPLTVDSGVQYFWASTTGLSTVQGGSLTVTGSGSVTGNFASLRSLTITATAGGTTDPAPGTVTFMNYSRGKVVSVTALPNTGYKLDHWLLDNIPVGAVNPIQVVVNSTHQLQAFFSEGWNLNIAVNGSGTTNPSQGTHTYPNGTVVTVTASPGIGYVFDHWLLDGNNNGTANSTHVLMNANHQLQAFFRPLNYTLTILAATNGLINPSPGSYAYSYGTLVNVSAVPNTGYGLDHWLLDGSNAGSANPIQVSMTTNHQLTAVFAPGSTVNYTLNITTTVGGATSPGAGNYVYPLGTVVTVTASPNTGYHFDHWSLDGNTYGTANTIQVTMNSTHQLQAIFTPLNYTLTITPTTNGSTNPSPGSHVYSYGTAASVTAQPNTGYVLDHWLLDNTSAGAANPISVTMTTNHQLTAVFAPFTGNYTLTVTATAGGATSPLPGVYTYFSGTVVTVTASPNTGYAFDHWSLDGNSVGTASSTQVTMNTNHQLKAFFASPLVAPAVWITPKTLSFDTVHTHVGDRFNVTVWINTTKPSYAWQVQVNYNASQLNVVRADYTGAGTSLFFTGHGAIPVSPTIDNQTGSVVHGESLIGFDQVPAGSTSLFWIEFMIMAAPAGEETLTSLVSIDTNTDNTFILDSDMNSVPGVGMGSANYILGYLPAVRDVAVTSLSLSNYTPRQGRNVTMSVVVLNNGTMPETFEVTLTLDSTLIAALNVPDLQPGNGTTLTFVWNTTAGTVDRHTITASATVVPSDTDPTNNEKSRVLTITSPTGPDTDINGDGRVDMVDIAMVSHAFGTREGDARWIPAADINGDGIINMIDIATVARDFGKIM